MNTQQAIISEQLEELLKKLIKDKTRVEVQYFLPKRNLDLTHQGIITENFDNDDKVTDNHILLDKSSTSHVWINKATIYRIITIDNQTTVFSTNKQTN